MMPSPDGRRRLRLDNPCAKDHDRSGLRHRRRRRIWHVWSKSDGPTWQLVCAWGSAIRRAELTQRFTGGVGRRRRSRSSSDCRAEPCVAARRAARGRRHWTRRNVQGRPGLLSGTRPETGLQFEEPGDGRSDALCLRFDFAVSEVGVAECHPDIGQDQDSLVGPYPFRRRPAPARP